MFVRRREREESKKGSSDRGNMQREREGKNLHLNAKTKQKTSSYNNGCEQKKAVK